MKQIIITQLFPDFEKNELLSTPKNVSNYMT